MDNYKSDTEETDETQDQSESSSNSGTLLLFMGGGSLALLGVALEVVPTFAPKYAWLVNGFAKHGVTGAPLALCGLIFLGLCVVSRARDKADAKNAELTRRETEARKSVGDQALILEQLSSDLAVTRGGMQDLRVEFVYLKDAIQNSQRQSVDPITGLDEAQAAIFRLAASMDQLGGRLEARLKSQDAVFHEVIGLLRDEISATNTSLFELRARIEQGIEDASSGPLSRTVSAELDEVDFGEVDFSRPGTTDEIELEQGYEVGDDDLTVEVELENNDKYGLGLLDDLDDQGKPHRSKTSPSIRPSIPRTNTYADLGLRETPAQPAPLPGTSPSHRVDEQVEAKLAALRALMADPSVRRALEASRNRA